MLFNFQENQYLDVLKKLDYQIELNKIRGGTGYDVDDRTGVGTQNTFGVQMRFDLRYGFPLFTHKQVFMRGIFEELMWFLRGETNIKTLVEKNVKIWNEWRYKAYINETFKEPISKGHCCAFPTMEHFIEKIKTDEEFAEKWGSIGKGYGYQWRKFGEVVNYKDYGIANPFLPEGHKIVTGFDQIEWVINEIKTNPTSRRLIVSGWNPHDVADVDLPPCHTLFQFFVKDGKLSCQLYQRSADLLLGVPFNIASYALLTHLVALECGLNVGEFVWVGGDCHIYSNQEHGLKEIVNNRIAFEAPSIKINKRDSIYDYTWEDIEIVGYKHQGKVEMPVAV
ncbi:putative thymidylate synthase [Acinetobacter phage vB_AbaM_Acibel004]|uniref:thymidylate synthase n=1 Tax=Acinetobacter phage vB_AbaM_Acibel004 TaxID=1481186 RepID=UPI0004E84A79|nr:thymidylate synthase [Acinetobacter phage vB_AbaM_Acibel004]AHY26643.1 putative thymidylate synthase [Acinetobacter phage vB_AbaM_Acibel004]